MTEAGRRRQAGVWRGVGRRDGIRGWAGVTVTFSSAPYSTAGDILTGGGGVAARSSPCSATYAVCLRQSSDTGLRRLGAGIHDLSEQEDVMRATVAAKADGRTLRCGMLQMFGGRRSLATVVSASVCFVRGARGGSECA